MNIEGKIIDSVVTDELLSIREKRWHKKFPDSFKVFLKTYNGLIPEQRISLGNDIVVERFLCVLPSISQSDEGYYDIDAILTKYDAFMVFSEDTLGYDLIPFAMLNRDKILCLCYEQSVPSVCIWSYEGSNEFKPNYSVVYSSFEEFLKTVCK